MDLSYSHFAGLPLIDVTLKALVTVAIAGLFAALTPGTKASTRHAIWLAASVVLLMLPIVRFALPQYSLPWLPAEPIATTVVVETLPLGIQQHSFPRTAEHVGSDAPVESTFVPALPAPSSTTRSWSKLGMIAWGLGVLLMSVRAVIVVLRIEQLRRGGEVVSDPTWRRIVEQVKRETRVRRDVRLLKSPSVRTPISWGTWRIYVCFPSHVDEWSATNRHLVLAHELTHARRGDYLWQWLANAMLTVHWYNPLAWWTAHRLRTEAEISCDSAVIAYGCRPSDYAACLYQMAQTAKNVSFRLNATLSIAFRSELPRRLAMILNDKTKLHAPRLSTLALSVIVAAILGSVFGTAQVIHAQTDQNALSITSAANEKDVQLLDHINASPRNEPGVFHVSPVFEELFKVTVANRREPQGPAGVRALEGWKYEKATGLLTVSEAVDNESEIVAVYGTRELPWRWQMDGAISDVSILIGTKAAVRGEDFEVDEAVGTVQFLKLEHCQTDTHYYISYRYRDVPGKSGAIGNHPDRPLVRTFLGLPPRPGNLADVTMPVGTNASRTDNSLVWTIARSMRTDSINVALGRRSIEGQLEWLEPETDYTYDDTSATITLLRNTPIEDDTWMFVTGVPTEQGRFLLRSALTKGEVKVILGDRLLTEGVGYEVDYEQGIVTIVDDAIAGRGAEYYISAGGRALGNHSDKEIILKLLRD